MARYTSADGRTIRVAKDASQLVSGVVLVNDKDFYIDGQPGQVFRFNILSFIRSNNASFVGMVAGWSYPSGASIRWNTSVDAASGSAALIETDTDTNNSPLANTNGACCQWDGVVTFGSVAGRVNFQLAQSVEGGEFTELAGSVMQVDQVV